MLVRAFMPFISDRALHPPKESLPSFFTLSARSRVFNSSQEKKALSSISSRLDPAVKLIRLESDSKAFSATFVTG